MQQFALRRGIVEPGKKSAFLALGLLACGVLGNSFAAELFFDIDFVFGSIATFLILYLYGPVAGILASVVISLPTVVL
ncbi:MAG: hypothetical protein ACLFM0_04470 [Spirochaetales bacterium]